MDAAVVFREAILVSTMEVASGEKPSPPYWLGIAIEKKPCFLMKFHTLGGMSRSSCVICQSSSIWQSFSVGPSRKACSSSVKFGAGRLFNNPHCGIPEKSSPSHQTLPASSASCSVLDMGGSILRKNNRMRLEINSLRSALRLKATRPANSAHRSIFQSKPLVPINA